MVVKFSKRFCTKPIILLLIGIATIIFCPLSYADLESTMEVYVATIIIDKPVSDEKCVLPSVTIKGREKVDDMPKTINWSITTNSYPDITISNSEEEKEFNINFPSNNDKFGNNTIRVRATAHGTNYEDIVNVKFFFSRDGRNNPGGATPNWYYTIGKMEE